MYLRQSYQIWCLPCWGFSLAIVQSSSLVPVSLLEWKRVFCASVCWEDVTCFADFTKCHSQVIAFSVRRDFGHLNSVRTVENYGH